MQHERMCSRVRGEDVSFRDVKIKIPKRKYDRGMWMTSSTGSVRRVFGGFEKSHYWVLASEEDGWLSELNEISPVICGGVPRVVVVVGGEMEKSELSFSVRRRQLTFGAPRDQTSNLRRGAARVSGGSGGGADWKISIERLCITPLMSNYL